MNLQEAEALVANVESVYQSQNAERIMDLFDPEIVVYWNGRSRWEGKAELREYHADPIAAYPEFEMQKSLQAASGDTIAVEWINTWIDTSGDRHRGFGGEFWTMHDGRLREWHAYHRRYGADDDAGEHADEYLSFPTAKAD